MQGDSLIVKVVENPIINQVIFEGNSALSADKIRDEVEIHPRSLFTRSRVLEDVQRIVELYRRSGRISAVVTPKIVQLPQKRVDLVFEISEGPKTGILRVNFLGNKEFSDSALRDVVVTKESAWYKFFTSNDNFDPDRIEYDREQLRKYYTNKGYYDFRVISSVAELTPNQRSFAVTYTMDEGSKYKFGKVTVKTDLKKLNANLLQLILPIKEGQLYRSDKIESAVDTLTFAAGASGFAFVDIRPRYTANRQNHTIDVVFEIKEGPRVYVERIDIVGNTQTLDPVIRQELRLAEGDAYNRVLVDRSKTELRRLGFFKTVDINQIPGSAAPTRPSFRSRCRSSPRASCPSARATAQSTACCSTSASARRTSAARADDVRIRASVGSLRQQIDFSYTNPRFQGRDLRVGYDIGYSRFDYTNVSGFDTASTFATIRAGFPTERQHLPRYALHDPSGRRVGRRLVLRRGRHLRGDLRPARQQPGVRSRLHPVPRQAERPDPPDPRLLHPLQPGPGRSRRRRPLPEDRSHGCDILGLHAGVGAVRHRVRAATSAAGAATTSASTTASSRAATASPASRSPASARATPIRPSRKPLAATSTRSSPPNSPSRTTCPSNMASGPPSSPTSARWVSSTRT